MHAVLTECIWLCPDTFEDDDDDVDDEEASDSEANDSNDTVTVDAGLSHAHKGREDATGPLSSDFFSNQRPTPEVLSRFHATFILTSMR